MAKFKTEVRSLLDARRFLAGKDERKIAHNTYVVAFEGGDVGLVFHNTCVVRWRAVGGVVLNSGGWCTVTTKQRINAVLPPGWFLYQDDWVWYVGIGISRSLFRDGMHL